MKGMDGNFCVWFKMIMSWNCQECMYIDRGSKYADSVGYLTLTYG